MFNRYYNPFLVILCSLIVASCSVEKENEIEWQLPLEAASDAHSAPQQETLPTWAKATEGSVEVVLLNKETTKVQKILVTSQAPVIVAGWTIELLAVVDGLRIESNAFIDDESVHNPAAFVALSWHEQVLYRGWLYQDFPELFGLDNPVWKVWINNVIVRAASEDNSEETIKLP